MITVRRIRIGEGELFLQIRLAALQESPHAFTTTYESAQSRSPESWSEQADRSALGSDRATFLAFSGELPVGIAALYRREGEAGVGELLQVWVAPKYRASAAVPLMDAVFQWAGANGFRIILASVKKVNIRALKFYIRYGFSLSIDASNEVTDQLVLTKDVVNSET